MYGLVGKNLSHSFSKEIHNAFGNEKYELINTNNLKNIFENKKLLGFNVTIPYKNDCIEYLDEIDDLAKKTNSVNTVVMREKRYIGYNTDYYGFMEMIAFNHINIEEKNVIVLGNGSVSNTVVLALETLKANRIVRLCRTKKNVLDDYYKNYQNYDKFDIMINTTPVGMYPHNEDDLLVDLSIFKHIELVIDLIYNPLRTRLLIEAQKHDIKTIDGLFMLVMQAKRAHELFFNIELPLNVANRVYKKMLKNTYNLVFIGLPLSGKSKYAKLFESKLNKKLYDTDQEIEKVIDMSIYDYFQLNSEAQFRMVETEIIKILFKQHNCIISTGGGAIKRDINIELLKQNGIIVFLNKNPKKIAEKIIKGRPLIKNSNDIIRIAEERMPLYKKASDIIIDIKKDTVYHINEIKEKINEYLNY
jgi:shikimate dehydrogenase